jgi:hypothetical protein
MLLLGISGRLLDDEELAVIDDLLVVMSSADPRQWPFKLTRLVASYGVAPYGVAATLVGSEGGMYGTNRLASTSRWLIDVARNSGTQGLADDEMLAILDAGGAAAGFGVLYRSRDERFAALVSRLRERKRDSLPFMTIALQAARIGRDRKQLEAHVSLAVAAACLDVGLSVEAIAGFWTLILMHCALANAIEGAAQAPPQLQQLPLDTIEYKGQMPRTSPRKQAATAGGT